MSLWQKPGNLIFIAIAAYVAITSYYLWCKEDLHADPAAPQFSLHIIGPQVSMDIDRRLIVRLAY